MQLNSAIETTLETIQLNTIQRQSNLIQAKEWQ